MAVATSSQTIGPYWHLIEDPTWADLTRLGAAGEKIVLTGLKADSKLYRRYTGFPGGLREESFVKLLARRPEAIVEQSIKGMLPKSKMGRQMGTKLKVYRGDKHPHQAQQPEVLELAAR